MSQAKKRRVAFTLVELVVVIVIIGILAAIAIPRLSRGSAGANQSALAADLAMVRNAINLYAAEHNNSFPGPDASGFVNELTLYSSVAGATNAAKSSTYKYGPYLVALPACPVGENAGSSDVLIDSTNSPPTPVTTGGEGWVYNPNTGEFLANTTSTDDVGTPFNQY